MLEHAWESCSIDSDGREAVRRGIELMSELKKTPSFLCCSRGEDCHYRAENVQDGCSGSAVIQRAVGALLFVEKRAEARWWVEEQEVFKQSVEEGKDERVALEELLSKKGL